MTCQTVHFVYLGKTLPQYAKASLALASEYSGMHVHLIGNRELFPGLNDSLCDFTAIEDFQTDNSLNVHKAKIKSDKNFRDGFWFKTLERFFVLYDFARYRQLKSIFHAELDQFLFGTDELVKNIEKNNRSGIFVPFHSDKAAIASVFYCNQLDALRSLLIEAINGDTYPNEMALIAQWAAKNLDMAVSLPTAASLIKGRNVATPKGLWEITASELGGVVDAAQLGQWIAGIDPRNVPIWELPKTKFVDKPAKNLLSQRELESLSFELGFDKRTLLLAIDKAPTARVFNLHIHSKIHQLVNNYPRQIDNLLIQASSKKREILKSSIKPWLYHHTKYYANALLTKPNKIIPGIGRVIVFLVNRFAAKIRKQP